MTATVTPTTPAFRVRSSEPCVLGATGTTWSAGTVGTMP